MTTDDREAWRRTQDVFHAALKLPVDQRTEFVTNECGNDPDLVERVLGMLAEDERDDSFLDGDVAQVAGAVLDGSVPHLKQVGPYRILSVLGQGGMGVVYLSEREDLGSKAAIKVLRDASLSLARKERFLSEQRTLAQLNHPNIARLYDADVLPDGTPYFVLEYVEGQPLDEYLAAHRPSLKERLHLFRLICSAVQFAHSRAVIHRDLKPSNVVVTADGTPKLLDFGIAKQLDELGGSAQMTRTGLMPLTPAYAAPEQVLGKPVGVFTDVYALGLLLYEMLTGTRAVQIDTLSPVQAAQVILESDVEPPSARADSEGRHVLSRSEWKDLDVLTATAMHADVTRRYPTVEALVRDVDHFLARQPLEARPDSLVYRVGKFVRRNAGSLALAGVALLVLTVTTTVYAFRLSAARDQAVAEADRTRRIQEFTQGLFTGGDVSAGPSDTLRALTLVDRGIDEARLLEADPEAQSQIYLTLGSILTQLGRYDQADTLLQRAAASQARADVDPGVQADIQTAQAELEIVRGAYDEAVVLAERALERAEEVEGPRGGRAAAAGVVLGRALEGLGEYDRAIAVLEHAVATIERTEPGSSTHSNAIGHLANTHFYAGDLDVADSLNRMAIEIDSRVRGPEHPNIADAKINLAVSEFQRGRYAEGEPLLREAVEIFEGYHGPEHPQTASALRMLGQNLIYQGRLEEAEPIVRRSLAISEQTLSPQHPRLANVLGDLAYIELQAGQFESAVERYRQIVEVYRATNGERHYFVAIGMSNLANALMEAGRLEESETMFVEVVDRFAESRGADHVDTGIAQIKLGHVLALQQRYDDALEHLVPGYELVASQTAPTVSWLTTARRDMIVAYEAMGRTADASRIREEQAAVEAGAAGS